eukprot:CAMPEP_0116839550 /NCGR_PEP_ID=MMETSP0418-20121206/9833_1 /TAXON_ID=1158023 /ORGANISM="Astrosyne radiata, Strain 13vi08-1A" /LENGTH=201 /DNA_ID=CAMNT_0004469681 /DNA_START=370 /DNA_END=976 /DNA_ORIENTATION=+
MAVQPLPCWSDFVSTIVETKRKRLLSRNTSPCQIFRGGRGQYRHEKFIQASKSPHCVGKAEWAPTHRSSSWARKTLVPRAERRVGVLAKSDIKISAFSDLYDANKHFAGIIVCNHEGKFQWKNTDGVAKDYNCRAIYVLILCTDRWPANAFKRAKQGYVHDYIYFQMFGRMYDDKVSCCGGFAMMKGEIKYNSVWLNEQSG